MESDDNEKLPLGLDMIVEHFEDLGDLKALETSPYVDTPHGRLYREKNDFIKFCLVGVAAVVGFIMGSMVTTWLGAADGKLALLLHIPYIVILALGLSAWKAKTNALLMSTVGKKVISGLFKTFILKRKPEGVGDFLPNGEKLMLMALKIQKAARVFLGTGFIVGAGTVFVGMMVETRAGLFAKTFILFASCMAWAYLLYWLGRRGYLLMSDQDCG